MKKILLAFITFLAVSTTFACTTFTLKTQEGQLFFGRNFDFPVGAGHVCINQRGISKKAFIQAPEKPILWKAKYGSITFNQAGREFPYGGMNEKGLVIEQMWLNEAKYPETDERHGLTELQWIQYQLDMSGTVQEVIDSDTLLRISALSVATLHFLVADAHGNTAAIEFLDGKMRVYRNDQLPHAALANCPYKRSIAYANDTVKAEGEYTGWTQNSSGRFATAAEMLAAYKAQNPVEYAFGILDEVAQEGGTQWSIVYDIAGRNIHLKTAKNKTVRVLQLNDFCFAPKCSVPLFADIHGPLTREEFEAFSYEKNLALVNEVFNGVDFLRSNVPAEARKATARYPLMIYDMGAPQKTAKRKKP